VKRPLILSGLAAAALAASALAAAVPGASAMPASPGAAPKSAVHACAAHATPGHATCLALVAATSAGTVLRSVQPLATAFTPADIQKAYGLGGLHSGGRTVAIVDAYGYPTLESDLAKFRSTYKLPACTTSNGCLTVVNQTGGSTPPPTDSGWDLEQALDVDSVSAACPDCKILVVQGNAPSFADLKQAENTAAAHPGVVAISNSYSGRARASSAYNHPGIAITASTGDSGYDPGAYPASDTHVVAVGGTSVFRDSSARGYHETVWSGAGSGCGSNPKPKWQGSAKTTCSTKASADVSAAADPGNGGLSIVYRGGFEQVGGTSESSPIIAAVYALSGKTTGYPAKFAYRNPGALYDITSGNNGSCGVPLCQARTGWDGPTGMGTPHGVGGF
jgi:subtilase family serine protease